MLSKSKNSVKLLTKKCRWISKFGNFFSNLLTRVKHQKYANFELTFQVYLTLSGNFTIFYLLFLSVQSLIRQKLPILQQSHNQKN